MSHWSFITAENRHPRENEPPMSHDDPFAENPILAELVEPAESAQMDPWGLGATIMLSLAVIGVFVVLQTAVVIGFGAVQSLDMLHAGDYDWGRLSHNGLLLSVATWISAPLCLAMVILLVRLRRWPSVHDYLALNRVSAKCLLFWTTMLLVVLALLEATPRFLGFEMTSEFMVDIYRTAVFLPLLWATLIVAAPVFEEIFFRGFMFRGIQPSRLGTLGAVLVTSFVWSMIHLQYNPYGIFVIFLYGVFLGVARARTNSTYLTIGLHSLINLVATIETILRM